MEGYRKVKNAWIIGLLLFKIEENPMIDYVWLMGTDRTEIIYNLYDCMMDVHKLWNSGTPSYANLFSFNCELINIKIKNKFNFDWKILLILLEMIFVIYIVNIQGKFRIPIK